uniref:Acyltransferase n=1 Tax=Panagrellus redivivus TaxID=6233 RepID=A0A7E4W436_PANRE
MFDFFSASSFAPTCHAPLVSGHERRLLQLSGSSILIHGDSSFPCRSVPLCPSLDPFIVTLICLPIISFYLLCIVPRKAFPAHTALFLALFHLPWAVLYDGTLLVPSFFGVISFGLLVKPIQCIGFATVEGDLYHALPFPSLSSVFLRDVGQGLFIGGGSAFFVEGTSVNLTVVEAVQCGCAITSRSCVREVCLSIENSKRKKP